VRTWVIFWVDLSLHVGGTDVGQFTNTPAIATRADQIYIAQFSGYPNRPMRKLKPEAGSFFEKLAAAAANRAIVVEYGALSMQPTPFPLFTALAKGLTIRGYVVSKITRPR
jgi:hypothetical protein